MMNLRTSPMVFDELKRQGERIANSAGPGHKVTAMVTRGSRAKSRARVQVSASTPEARRANFEQNVLLKALGGSDYTVYRSKQGRTSLISNKQANNYRSRSG
ncbi:hypothetical protein [Paeniglutamicibacter terrestris]|uniref:HK97 gp10 family phage protein n=1 Tax=Paeniglutamicibacter terrestris TaxID=2723403 RepID=A0ABX1G6R2_9MICC|nr:hypothetical protein [Paeniglutamicibacter terrestris]NKG21107.1 hypothetical protein [Paeniglutamicibacter terrestris]